MCGYGCARGIGLVDRLLYRKIRKEKYRLWFIQKGLWKNLFTPSLNNELVALPDVNPLI